MTTAADNCISLAEGNMRTTLSNSSTFITLVSAANAAAAIASIYRWALPKPSTGTNYTLEELESYRPYAIISTRAYNAKPRGAGAYGDGGTFEIELVRDIPEADLDDEAEILTVWMNIVGGIMDDLKALRETLGHDLGEIRLDDYGPWRNHRTDWPTQGRIQGCSIFVDWGAG